VDDRGREPVAAEQARRSPLSAPHAVRTLLISMNPDLSHESNILTLLTSGLIFSRALTPPGAGSSPESPFEPGGVGILYLRTTFSHARHIAI
jgi:hypothetical protein